MTIRRLGPGDEEIVVQLGGERPLTHAQAADLLADERTLHLVAFDRHEPIGSDTSSLISSYVERHVGVRLPA